MNTKQPISQFAILFVRYIVAIVATYLTANLVFFVFSYMFSFIDNIFSSSDEMQGRTPTVISIFVLGFIFFTTGFFGVFAGAICLPRPNRRLASMFLLILGVSFSTFMILLANYFRGGNEDLGGLIWVLPLAAGGATSVWFFWRRSHNKAQDLPLPTPVQ